jgi:hypothetical protein
VREGPFAETCAGWVKGLDELAAAQPDGKLKETRPTVPDLLSAAAQRVATAVDEAYDAAVTS